MITVDNKSILINIPFHFETIWIKDLGALRGTLFEKNQMNLLITPAQAIGRKTPDLETLFLKFFKNQTIKNDKFL